MKLMVKLIRFAKINPLNILGMEWMEEIRSEVAIQMNPWVVIWTKMSIKQIWYEPKYIK